MFSSFGCPAAVHLHLTPSRSGPLLSLCLLRLSWVPALAPCSQLISMTILNFSQLLNFLAIHLPILAILCFLSPAAPLPHTQNSAMHLSQPELLHVDCFLNLYATWTSLKVIFGVQERASVLSFSCLALLQKTDCKKEQLQEMTWSVPASGERKCSA